MLIGELSKLDNMSNIFHRPMNNLAYKDRKYKMPRETLDRLSGEATPTQWAKYIVSSTAIKIMQDGTTPMEEKLWQRAYVNDRCPGKPSFINRSKLKIGRQSLTNRLDFFREIEFDWCG